MVQEYQRGSTWTPERSETSRKTSQEEGLPISGGREGIRTPDPRVANAVLSQLSYSPTGKNYSIRRAGESNTRMTHQLCLNTSHLPTN